MISRLLAERTILLENQSVGIVLLVLERVVVSVFALRAFKRDLGSRCFSCHNRKLRTKKLHPFSGAYKYFTTAFFYCQSIFSLFSIIFILFLTFFTLYSYFVRRNIFCPAWHTVLIMPTALTHYLIAKKALSLLPVTLSSKVDERLYYFGAQGGDPLFFYPVKGYGSLGRFLHGARVRDFFLFLRRQTDPAVFSYALGYVTHYCADTFFHPDVFRRSGAKGEKEDLSAILKHHAIEHAYDGAYSRLFLNANPARFRLAYPKGDISAVRSAYGRYLRLSGIPFYAGAFDFSVRAFYLLNSRRTPLYRSRLAENAGEKFERCVSRTVELIQAFVDGEIGEAFSRHFLTGEFTQ